MESATRFGKKALDLDIKLFFYLLEVLFLDVVVPESGFSEYSNSELRDHFKAALYNNSESESEADKYEDFPDDPLKMNKEDKLRIDFQAEQNPERKEKKRVKFLEYRQWKRSELKRREQGTVE